MSTTSWMQAIEPPRANSSKYEDVMAEFRANGRDTDTSSLGNNRASSTGQTLASPTPPTVSNQTSASSVSPTPCSLCGVCPPANINNNTDFASSKDVVGSPSASALPASPTLSAATPTLASLSTQFNNMNLADLQQHFGAGLRKLLVDKPAALRQDPVWPFLHKDYSQLNPPSANSNIWLNANQYARTNNLQVNPINNMNSQLQRIQQLRPRRSAFAGDECVFCRNNGEHVAFYRSHELKDELGRVVCPVLRAFTCPCCGATGDYAHTIKYCPENKNGIVPFYFR